MYRLVVEYEPRGGIAGLFDRLLLERGIRRAFESHVCGAEAGAPRQRAASAGLAEPSASSRNSALAGFVCRGILRRDEPRPAGRSRGRRASCR